MRRVLSGIRLKIMTEQQAIRGTLPKLKNSWQKCRKIDYVAAPIDRHISVREIRLTAALHWVCRIYLVDQILCMILIHLKRRHKILFSRLLEIICEDFSGFIVRIRWQGEQICILYALIQLRVGMWSFWRRIFPLSNQISEIITARWIVCDTRRIHDGINSTWKNVAESVFAENRNNYMSPSNVCEPFHVPYLLLFGTFMSFKCKLINHNHRKLFNNVAYSGDQVHVYWEIHHLLKTFYTLSILKDTSMQNRENEAIVLKIKEIWRFSFHLNGCENYFFCWVFNEKNLSQEQIFLLAENQ